MVLNGTQRTSRTGHFSWAPSIVHRGIQAVDAFSFLTLAQATFVCLCLNSLRSVAQFPCPRLRCVSWARGDASVQVPGLGAFQKNAWRRRTHVLLEARLVQQTSTPCEIIDWHSRTHPITALRVQHLPVQECIFCERVCYFPRART